MATSQSQKALYAPGEDLESIAANQAYQDALAKLTKSLDVRKNRLFDPVLLSIAEGFLGPTQTGSFGEALGRVAGKIGPAEAAAAKERQDIAAFELDLASKGIELQRQKARDAMVRRFLSGEEGPSAGALPTSSRAEAGEPSGARPAQGALAQAQGAPGREMGIQIAPGTPGISRQQFFSLGLADGKNISDLAKEWEAIQRGRLQARENFMIDTGSGRAYALPTGNTVEIQIFNRDGSPPKTYKVPANQAAELSELARNNDAERYFALAERITQGPKMPSARPVPPAASQQPAAPAAPTVSAPPQPATVSQPANVGAQAAAAAPSSDRVFPEPGSQVAKVQEFINQRIIGQIPEGLAGTPAQAVSPAASAAAVPSAAAQTAVPPVAVRPAPAAAATTQAAPVPASQAAVAPAGTPTGLRSKEDIEAEQRRILLEQERAKALQTAEVESEIKNRSEITDAAKKAREITATANILRRFSDSPNFSKMTGILNNKEISSGLAMLVRDGIGGKSISIGIPAIEDVMRNARLTPAEQAQYRIFLMYTAQMNLAAENSMKGSTTERERLILGNATISNQDTRETVRTKADLLNLKAQFDKRVANAFENSKMTPKEFFRSDKFDTMYSTYLENLEEVAVGAKMLPPRGGVQPGAQRQGAPAQGGNAANAAAGDRLRELLNRPQQRRP